jgi:hypothetical protein
LAGILFNKFQLSEVRIFKEEKLNFASSRLAPLKTSRKDLGIVDNDKITGLKKVQNINKIHILEGVIPGIEYKKPGLVPFLSGKLGNLICREIIAV